MIEPIMKSRVLCLSVVVCGLAMVVAVPQALAGNPPNVIVIYTDDQGYGDASCLNPQAKFKTPHLDRLAREGILFTDAHSSDTVCTPSRYGLLTGRYSWRTELKRGVFQAERSCLISADRMTVPSMLRQHRYRTAMIGKWHLGMDFPGDPGKRDWTQPVTDMPLDKGFDYFFGIPASLNYGILAWFKGRYAKVPPTQYTAKKPNRRALSDYRIKPPYEPTPQAVRRALGKPGMEIASDFVDAQCLTRFTDEAIAWMQKEVVQRKNDRPFFLYLPYTSPHKPVIPLVKYRGQGAAGAYGEFMIETDDHIGRLLKFLDDHGLADNTMIIFTSDNGPETTWKQRAQKYSHQSNGKFRGGKRAVYEGGHRVPMIIRWPQGIKAPGRRYEGLVGQTDLFATLADVVGYAMPANVAEDSRSFYRVFSDPQTKMAPDHMVHHGAKGRFAIRQGPWKLAMKHGKQPLELFNLAIDPSETRDVADRHPEIVKQLTQLLTSIVCSGRSFGPASRAQRNDTEFWSDLTWLSQQEYDRQHGQVGVAQ